MLVLTRKPDERIIINGNIVVSVLQIDGGRVKLGIEAPADVSILRNEICEEIKAENRRAAAATPAALGHSLAVLRGQLNRVR